MLRDFVLKLFSEHNSELKIGLFDCWHLLFLGITFGMALIIPLIFKNKSEKTKRLVVDFFAYLTIFLYVIDFFIMPLSDSYDGISAYKLPFNICTISALLVPFVQFNKRFAPIKTTVVFMGMAGSLMWMCYPGTALGGQPPFCYLILQTFFYHSVLFCYGVCAIALGDVKPNIKHCWKEFLGVLCMFVWAKFGNAIYGKDNNWFFIETSIFPFLRDQDMPYVVIASVFGVILALYGIYYLICAIDKRTRKPKSSDDEETPKSDAPAKEEEPAFEETLK